MASGDRHRVSMWPSLARAWQAQQVGALCVRPSGNVLPQTDWQMPALEVPASCQATLSQKGRGSWSGSYRGVCSLTYPQLSGAGGRFAVHSPGSRHLPQSPLRKPWAQHLRQVSWGPSQASLHQQALRIAFLNLGAWSRHSGTVLQQSGFGARPRGKGGIKASGTEASPSWQQIQATTASPSGRFWTPGRRFPDPFGQLFGAISNLSKNEASASHFSMASIHPGHRHVSAASARWTGRRWASGKAQVQAIIRLGLKLYPCTMFPVAILFFKKLLITFSLTEAPTPQRATRLLPPPDPSR